MSTANNAVKLTNWQRMPSGHLTGVPHGHPRLTDGKLIITTPVQRQYRDGARLLAQTRNTLYELRRDDGAEWFKSTVEQAVKVRQTDE